METTPSMTTAPPANVAATETETETTETAAPAATPKSVRPEKFKTDEEWRKGYDELVSKFTAPKAEGKQAVVDAFSEENRLKYAAEIAETGKLSQESRKRLYGIGATDDILDAHETGLVAIKERNGLLIGQQFKSEERYKAALEWAESNLDDETRSSLLKSLWSASMENVKRAAKTLDTLYGSGTPRNGIARPGTSAGGAKPFGNDAEQSAAFADHRWWDKAHPEHEAYKQHVIDRLKASIG